MSTNIIKRYSQNYILYLPMLYLVLYSLPILLRILSDQPLLYSQTSYHFLANLSYFFNPLGLIPFSLIPIFSILLGLITLFISISVLKKTHLSSLAHLLLLLIVILPTTILSYTSITPVGIFLFLLVLTVYLMQQKSVVASYLALVPITLATSIDLSLSAILLTIIIAQKNKTISLLSVAIAAINFFLLKIPLVNAPSSTTNIFASLITDLGSSSGTPLFILLLAIIGFALSNKKNMSIYSVLLLVISVLSVVWNQAAFIPLSLMLCLFASISLNHLIQKKWQLPSLKNFTSLLLILGILFSTTTFLEHIPNQLPDSSQHESLHWILKSTSDGEVILAPVEHTPFIQVIAQRPTASALLDPQIYQTITTATYVQDLFPLLEEHEISIIYIPNIDDSQTQSFRFLLTNERFKLLHSNKQVQVWVFR